MSIKTIITEPNKILRQISQPVEKVGKEEKILMDDMLDTMYAANGIGLAAIQIGVPKRIIVMDITWGKGEKSPMYFVNPVIKYKICFFVILFLKIKTATRLIKIGVDPLINPARLDVIVSSALANK